MKKTICILNFLIFSSIAVFSQEVDIANNDKYLKNYFYFAPLPTISKTFQISYERIIGNAKKSIQISGGILASGYNNNMDLGFTDEIQFRFYLNDIRNSGKENKFHFAFYFSPFIAHKYFKSFSYFYDYSNSISLGLVSGWKGTYSRFVFDIFIGGGFKKSMTNKNNQIFAGKDYWDGNYTGVLPKIGIQLGFSF